MCNQQRLNSACTYAQSDLSLSKSLECSMSVKLLTEHNLEFLSLKGGCTGWYESTLVKMPHCWESHVAAHLLFVKMTLVQRFIHRVCMIFTCFMYAYQLFECYLGHIKISLALLMLMMTFVIC